MYQLITLLNLLNRSDMKKYLFFVLLLICVSCEQPANYKPVTTEKVNKRIRFRVSDFEHEGHQYIYFKENSGKYATGGIVHNPNCTCKQ